MYKVLIVDDDRAIRYMLKRFKNWNNYGFSVEGEACDGKEAIKMLKPSAIDLVITDIRMPGIDGIEFMQELKRIKYETCVIFLSTHSDFEYAKQGIRLGVFDYMTKPVDETILSEVLERAKAYLDEKHQEKIKIEKEHKLIEDSIHVYNPMSREKRLATLLMSGDKEFFKEAETTFIDTLGVFESDLFKAGMLLEIIIGKLYGLVCSSYLWIEKVEKLEFEDLRNALSSSVDLKEKYLRHVKDIYEIVKKYELYQSDSIVKKTCEFVLNHVEDEIKLEGISQEVHVRSDYIGKLFKKKTGYNLNDYITKVKMEHAKYLIRTGDYKNYEVSDKLGYSSPDYFCRLFKSYTGCTPIEYRKTAI